jgi:hypothetical protein
MLDASTPPLASSQVYLINICSKPVTFHVPATVSSVKFVGVV